LCLTSFDEELHKNIKIDLYKLRCGDGANIKLGATIFLTSGKSWQLHVHACIQSFDSCNLMPESSDILSCLNISQYSPKIVKIVCLDPVLYRICAHFTCACAVHVVDRWL
jgi:hypothetical protein